MRAKDLLSEMKVNHPEVLFNKEGPPTTFPRANLYFFLVLCINFFYDYFSLLFLANFKLF